MRALTGLLVAVSATALVAPSARAAGQDYSDVVAYVALVATPTAGVAPVARQWMLAAPRKGTGFDLQWGHQSEEGAHDDNIVGGLSIPFAAGHADVNLSAGYDAQSCDGGSCKGNFVASAGVEGSVLRSRTPNALYAVGLAGRLGFAKPSGGTILSASMGVPLSVAIGKADGVQLVPFVTPALGWGRLSGGGTSESGTRLMLGGGIGVMNGKSGLGVSVGVQKVFISGGQMVFGAGPTWSALR